MGFLPRGFGFSRTQREQDAWEVKAYQDRLQSGSHSTEVPDNIDELDHAKMQNQAAKDKAEFGGFRQNWRAFALAIAAYNGYVLVSTCEFATLKLTNAAASFQYHSVRLRHRLGRRCCRSTFLLAGHGHLR